MKRVIGLLSGILLLLAITGTSNAALIDRGGGLIYDSDQNITWLQDANLAATNTFDVSGIYSGGYMSWNTAEAWIAAMNMANYKGYHDWRLPATVDGPYVFGYDGTTTAGYNITTSEMGYMYYVNLGNLGHYATDGTNPQPGWGLNNTSPFNNLQSDVYWSGTEYSAYPDNAWLFVFGFGDQGHVSKAGAACAWVVRPGDVSAVPIPGAVWLLGSGLACLGAYRRKLARRHG